MDGSRSRLSQWDLEKKASKLESLFPNVINKIPDLTMPVMPRWANEDDFFDKTKDLKLVPFRKQEVFERCISPELEARYERVQSPTLITKPARLKRNEASDKRAFANPMPACMLVKENVDTLRKIIVASRDIEWRMLTPIRPSTDYEEKFFDKLVYLHRMRHETWSQWNQRRLDVQGDEISPAFKHTRHGICLTNQMSSRGNTSAELINVGIRLKKRFRSQLARTRLMSSHLLAPPKLTVPLLTLTNDEQVSGEPISSNFRDDENDDDEDASASGSNADGRIVLDYSDYSRHSSKARFADDAIAKQHSETNSTISRVGRSKNGSKESVSTASDDLLDRQFEEIVGRLMIAD